MRPKVDPLSIVPAGVTVDVTVTFPKELGGMCEGFRWKAPLAMSADQVRGEIGRDLFTPFLDSFLLSTPKEKS